MSSSSDQMNGASTTKAQRPVEEWERLMDAGLSGESSRSPVFLQGSATSAKACRSSWSARISSRHIVLQRVAKAADQCLHLPTNFIYLDKPPQRGIEDNKPRPNIKKTFQNIMKMRILRWLPLTIMIVPAITNAEDFCRA